jgi:hypothetical protein
MMQYVMHQPRVAWDFARTLVSAAEADDKVYATFSAQVGGLLGTRYRQQLSETRARLRQALRPDSHQVEVGLWRVRMEDLLRGQAELTQDVASLRQETASLLANR